MKQKKDSKGDVAVGQNLLGTFSVGITTCLKAF